jgi:hypothetical protein
MDMTKEKAMRQLSGHIVNPANDKIKIEVVDDPGHGGASHYYLITGVDYYANAALKAAHDLVPPPGSIIFQNGPIGEHSPNGVTQEALLEIVADRLRSFQAGPYACRENALALTKIEEAQHWLQQRTLARMRRGVEGKSVV